MECRLIIVNYLIKVQRVEEHLVRWNNIVWKYIVAYLKNLLQIDVDLFEILPTRYFIKGEVILLYKRKGLFSTNSFKEWRYSSIFDIRTT